jgi:endonuclease I
MTHLTQLPRLALVALFFSTFLALTTAQTTTIAYWNFNVDEFSDNWPQPISATIGDASISYNFSQAYFYKGTDINGLGDEIEGGSFCPRGGSANENNGCWLLLPLPDLTASEIILSYATRRTGTGFTIHEVQYTLDGSNWLTHQVIDISGYANSWKVSQVEELIFSGIEGITENEDFAIRIVLDGATSSAGNTRFDNLLLQSYEAVLQTEASLQSLSIGGIDALSFANVEVENAESDIGALYEVDDFSLLTGISLSTVCQMATTEVFVNSALVQADQFANFVWQANDEIVVTVTAEDPQHVKHYKVTLSQKTVHDTFTLSGEVYDFKEVEVGSTSDVQFFYLSADEQSDDIVITAPDGFRISEDCHLAFASSLNIPPTIGGISDKKIFVRFLPIEEKDYSGSLLIQTGQTLDNRLLSGSGVGSNIPEGYYSMANGQQRELMTQLHEIINDHIPIFYSQIWTVIGLADRQFNGTIWDVYSSLPCSEPPYEFEYSDDQDKGDDTNQEGAFYNREHAWPSSWWGGSNTDTMFTDVHHIFPCDKVVNAQRGNNPFGVVGSIEWTSLNGSLLGNNNYGEEFTGTVFEPIDAYKGDFARAWFYFVTRYQHRLVDWADDYMVNLVLNGNDWPAFKPWVLEMLLEWHRNDPVSQKEIIRNDAIWLNQGNRNPYVDYPEFVEKVFSAVTSERRTLAQDIRLYPNPFSESLCVASPTQGLSIRVYDSMGREVYVSNQMPSVIDTCGWPRGIYVAEVFERGRLLQTFKLIK